MRTTLTLGPPERIPVSVALAPGPSMLNLIIDSLSGRTRGAPETWRRLIQSKIKSHDETIARSLAPSFGSRLPNLVLPGDLSTDVRIETQIEILRDLPKDALLDELEEITQGDPQPHWQPAVDEPERWLRGYADLLEQVWQVMAPIWRRARPLLDHEIERVAVAAVRGGLDMVLNGMHADCRFQGGVLSFPDAWPAEHALGSRRLVLKPMLAGRSALAGQLDMPDAVWIGYPLPGIGTLTVAPPRPSGKADDLVLVIGDVRAAILRGLDRPLTMSRLAKVIQHAPNAVTYHCDRLETAGLILRQRIGREIHVHRTERAVALIDLLGSDPAAP